MSVPLIQQVKVGRYILGQRLKGIKRYPLVLMLEPLFQCNLECAGCGKIDYEDSILKRRMSVDDALAAVDECGAPMVSIPGGEPLIHKEMPQMVQGMLDRGKFVYLCTNALLLKKKMDDYTPSSHFTWSVHLDGLKERHDESVCREGVFETAVEAIKMARDRGFRVNINCTLFDGEDPKQVADFFDFVGGLGIEGITVSPGYEYEHAPNQEVFLPRSKSKQLFRDIFRHGRERGSDWPFNHSPLFLDFIAGNEQYQCTPWSNPTYNIFGWQKPCYLMADAGYARTFRELMDDTEWESYGTGRHPKCDNCMAHCGYEGTAVNDTFAHPLKALKVARKGVDIDGPMAPELPMQYGNRADAMAHKIPVDQIGNRSKS